MTFFFISVIYGLNPYTFCCRIKYWFIGLVAILYLSCIESLIVNREQKKLVQKKEF